MNMVLIKYCFFCFSPLNVANFLRWKPKKDIVRTYPWICMSAQCPHNVRTMSALCPHNISRGIYVFFIDKSADIVRTYICRDICPHYILLRFSPLVMFCFLPFAPCKLIYEVVTLWFNTKIRFHTWLANYIHDGTRQWPATIVLAFLI